MPIIIPITHRPSIKHSPIWIIYKLFVECFMYTQAAPSSKMTSHVTWLIYLLQPSLISLVSPSGWEKNKTYDRVRREAIHLTQNSKSYQEHLQVNRANSLLIGPNGTRKPLYRSFSHCKYKKNTLILKSLLLWYLITVITLKLILRKLKQIFIYLRLRKVISNLTQFLWLYKLTSISGKQLKNWDKTEQMFHFSLKSVAGLVKSTHAIWLGTANNVHFLQDHSFWTQHYFKIAPTAHHYVTFIPIMYRDQRFN